MPKTPGAYIQAVEPGSLAAEVGLEPGDCILEIDGAPILDVVDFRFLTAGEEITLRVRKGDGQEWLVELEKDYDDDLGVAFAADTFDGIRRCRNKCLFCFLDQLPTRMRPSLYLKDDDYRLSFLHGAFITLSNLSEAERQRIVAQRLSPLYVSVHTTDPRLRRRMMGGAARVPIMESLAELAGAGIDVHTQIVVCPGWNDGAELARTVDDLASLWPRLRSIALVPVGLTAFQRRRTELRPVDAALARWTVDWALARGREFKSRLGSNLVFLADEFLLLAGEPVPSAAYYEGFPQLANGVGLLRSFRDEFEGSLGLIPDRVDPPRTVTVVTGRSAQVLLAPMVAQLNAVPGLEVDLLPVTNHFFGPTVTVTGLLTGRDILAALKERQESDRSSGTNVPREVLLPEVVLREGEGIFLDDLEIDVLRSTLGQAVRVVPVNGDAFLRSVLG